MSFGIFADSGDGALLMTDAFNPYYYRGVAGWWGLSSEPHWVGWGGSIGVKRNQKAWTLDSDGNGTVDQIYEGGACTLYGFFKFPRFADTDIIFFEPLSSYAGLTVNSLTVDDGGATWKLDFCAMCDVALYDFVGKYTDQSWPDEQAGYSALCPVLPKIHLFSQLSAAGLTSDRHGIAIFDKNGKVKYNSSRSPLRIKDIVYVNYPAPTVKVMDRRPTGKNYTPHVYCNRPMYSISAVTQAVSQYWWSDKVTNKSYLGDLGPSVTTSWSFQYWGVYGGALSRGSNSSVQTSWAMQGYGSQANSSTSGSFFFGLIPTGSSQSSNGEPPYTDAEYNHTNMPCLVADAADYV